MQHTLPLLLQLDRKRSVLFSKSVKKSVKSGVRVLRARSSRASHARRAVFLASPPSRSPFLATVLQSMLQRKTSELHVLWRRCGICSQKILLLVFLFAFFTVPLSPYWPLAVLSFSPAAYHVFLPTTFVSFVF